MPNDQKQSQGSTAQKPAMSLQEELMNESRKTMKKAVSEQTAQRLAAGQSPEEILLSLAKSMGTVTNQLAQEKVPVAGTTIGVQGSVLNVLSNLLTGSNKSVNPFSPQMAPMGTEAAMKQLDMANNVMGEQRRQQDFERKGPMIEAKASREQLALAYEQAQKLGDYSALNALAAEGQNRQGQVPQNEVTDPAMDPAFRIEFKKEEIKRVSENRKELDKFTATAQPLVQRFLRLQDVAEEMKDYKPGVLNQVIAEGDVLLGKYAKDEKLVRYNSTLNRMLGLLVRLGGDTGAFSDPEQKRQLEAAGKESLPLSTKIQLINDFLEDMFVNIDTKKELAKYPDYEKRFPMMAKARERYEQNKKRLQASPEVDEINAFLAEVSKNTKAKITYTESESA